MTTGPSARRRWWPIVAAVAVLCAGTGGSVALSRYQADAIAAGATDSFTGAAGSISAQTDLHLSRYVDLVSAMQGLHRASERVSHVEAHRYLDTLLTGRRYPGLEAMISVPSRRGEPDLARIHIDAELDPADIGITGRADAVVTEVFRRATSTGSPTLSAPLALPHSPGEPAGLLLVAPVFEGRSDPGTPQERRKTVSGWVGAAIRADHFLSQVLVRDLAGIGTQLFDGPPSTGTLVNARPRGFAPSPQAADERLIAVAAAGRLWTMRMQPLPQPEQGLPIPQVVLLAGLLLSAMLAGVVWSVGRSKNAALGLVDSTTRELRYSEQRFRSLASASPLGIFGLAPDGSCEYVNERLLSLTERSVDELTGDGLVDAFHPDDRSVLRWAWADTSSPAVVRLRVQRRDGTVRWVKAHAAPLRGEGEALKGWVGSVEDITSEVEAQEASQRLAAELAHRARHDHLTGLPNRAYLMDRLSAALNRHRGLRSPVTLLFFDLDRFKIINDSLGHDAGDRLLVAVAERLSASLQPGDVAARFGGDEFVVCLTSTGSQDAAVAEAERIMAAVCHPVELGHHEVSTTVSMGLAIADADVDVDAATLLTRADDAMYRAKDNGKARIEVYRPAKHARGHGSVLEMERDLREAIDGERLHLLYQPLVVISSGAVVGAEALVRWRHPERGLLPPAHFIALAEDSGLIVPLGTWVLRTACAQLSGWRRRLDASRALTMTVNVSARQLADPGFSAVVATALSDFGTDPTSLTLEITESALLHDVATGEAALESLRRIGVRIAVDDFGTGYSSLSRLNVLPVDMLKIDRSFVADIGGRGQGTAIVAAVVRLAAALGLTSVAEGVERAEQMDWLASVGCDLAQGYHLGRPAEPEVVEPLLSAGLASYSGIATRLSPV